MIVEADVADREAEEIVDLLLRQHAFAIGGLAAEVAAAVLDHGGPLQRHVLGELILGSFRRGRRGILGIERGFPLGRNGVLVHLVVAGHGFTSAPSLDHDFLEQHRVDLVGRQREVDALGQLLLEAEQAGRAVEVARAQLAHIGLEQVGDARQRRLDRLDL
ncbi:hypothetical protein chiPu_0034015, partial [Chiloscyllium punctatum]|nr:hypothetical protein [Chiloscyllium punctatum]